VLKLDSTEQNLDLFGDRIGLDKEAIRLSAQIEYDAGPWSLAWNTGYFNADSTYGYDVDITSNFTALGGSFNRIAVSDRSEISSELVFRTDETQRIRGLAGVYMYQSRRDFREDRLNGSTVDEGEQRVDNQAIFGAIEADLTDRLTGRVELRYAEDKIGNNNPAGRPTLALIENTFSSTSPRVSLDYKLTEDNLVYVAAAKGNKPGFINSNPLLDLSLRFADEESAWNYEVGSKNTFRDGRTILNAAVYYIDWKDQQLTTGATLSNGNPVTVVVNIGETEVTGFELELSNQFTDRFTGGLGFSYNDAEITSAYDQEQCQFNTPTSEGPAIGCTVAPPTNLTFLNRGSLAGKQTPNSPKNQITAFGRYDFNVSDAVDGYFRVDYAYTSKKFSQVFNLAHTGEQQLVNMKLGFDTANWKFSVFVDNLFDDRTPSTVIRFVDFKNPLPVTTVVPTTPADTRSTRTSASVRGFQYPLADKRQLGLTVAYKF
jgi:iron complex outermembrane receptor protein